MRGLSLGLGLSSPSPPGPSGLVLGSEVWPQPAFDASTGLSLQNASVTGGELVFTSGAGAMICLGLLNGADTLVVGQTWRVSGECTEFNVGSVIDIRLGCAANTLGGTLVEAAVTETGAFSFDVVLTTVTTQRAVINDVTDAASSKFTSLSIKRVISS